MLGKVIGGGLPVGAFGGRRDIMNLLAPLGPVYQAGTLSGNPLAMVAGLVTLREWSKPGVFEGTAEATSALVAGLLKAAESSGVALQSENVGTMFGFFFSERPVRSFRDTSHVSKDAFVAFFREMLNQGVYFAPSAFEAGFVSAAHRGAPIKETIEKLSRGFASLG
jgi:glutamate-1-semialdehyde 2,1-aminomutase